MRRNQTLSQRAQTSVTQPRSRVRVGSSQRAAFGCRFGSKTSQANSAPAQIAARLQRKIPIAGPLTTDTRSSASLARTRGRPRTCSTLVGAPTRSDHTFAGGADLHTGRGERAAPGRAAARRAHGRGQARARRRAGGGRRRLDPNLGQRRRASAREARRGERRARAAEQPSSPARWRRSRSSACSSRTSTPAWSTSRRVRERRVTCCSAGGSARTRSRSGTAYGDGFAGRRPLEAALRNRRTGVE